MAPVKIFNLIALTTLAIMACSFSATPVNALSAQHSRPHTARAHHALAKRNVTKKAKRSSSGVSRRCKPKDPNSSNPAPSSSPPAPTDSSAPAPPASQAPAPSPTPAPSDPAPAPSSQAPSAPAPSPAPSSGGKVALAWANGDSVNLAPWKTDDVHILYTWSPNKPAMSDQLGFDFAAMLWGTNQIDDFNNLVKPGYCKYIMGFNEPDLGTQSNLDPQTAASLWQQFIQPHAQDGVQLITPAVTSAPEGKTWMTNFMNACSGCTFNIMAVHIYATTSQDLINYVNDMHSTFNLPIFVSEYACQSFSGGAQCDAGQVSQFMEETRQFFDNTDFIMAYSAFGVMTDLGNVNPLDALMNSDGTPNQLGLAYINNN